MKRKRKRRRRRRKKKTGAGPDRSPAAFLVALVRGKDGGFSGGLAGVGGGWGYLGWGLWLGGREGVGAGGSGGGGEDVQLGVIKTGRDEMMCLVKLVGWGVGGGGKPVQCTRGDLGGWGFFLSPNGERKFGERGIYRGAGVYSGFQRVHYDNRFFFSGIKPGRP